MARSLPELAEAGLIDPSWAGALSAVAPDIARMGDFLRAEVADGRPYLPAGDRVLRAFQQPVDGVRVLIVGQDPYPTPGHPIGLSFAVERHVRPLPRSLGNIYRERESDLGIPPAPHGDLTAWSDQGVLLHRGYSIEELATIDGNSLDNRPDTPHLARQPGPKPGFGPDPNAERLVGNPELGIDPREAPKSWENGPKAP